jgi:hypothetical protein
MIESRYCVKIFNNRYVKISVCHGDKEGLPAFKGNDRNNEKRALGEDEMLENLKRSARRAYQQVIAKANGLGVDRMLTLTFAKNVGVESKDVAMACFARFTRLCRDMYGAFEYIATLETQKRGAIHFHLGLNKYFNVWHLWELWKRAIVDSGLALSTDKTGSVFINKKAKLAKGGVVVYIAKYIMKEAYKVINSAGDGLREKYGKRYLSSKVPVEKVVFIAPFGNEMMIFQMNFEDFELKNGVRAFIKEFKHVNSFVLGLNWSFSCGFLRDNPLAEGKVAAL